MFEKVSCAERLRQAAKFRNIKQVELCEKTGIKKSAMSQYFKGTFEPKQDGVYLLAAALDVSEAWLMGFDVPMEKNKLTISEDDELISLVEQVPTHKKQEAVNYLRYLIEHREK